MQFAKTGEIHNFCHPNALMTLKEYLEDYASPETKAIGEKVIAEQLPNITDPVKHRICAENIKKIEEGQRDFRF